MAIKLFTDISCDLPLSYTKENDVTVLPIITTLNGVDYQVGNDPSAPGWLDWHECYEAVRGGAEVKTAQIYMETFREEFRRALDSGDDILYSAFSSGLSGTYNTACIVAAELMEQYPGRQVRVVDSLSASLGHGVLVWLAVEKLKSGAGLDELESYLNSMKLKIHHWFTVDDLNHLRRGGRISAATAVVGTMLSIKPVLNVDDEGHLISKQKARGRKNSFQMLLDHMDADWDRDPAHPVMVNHGDCPQDARLVASMIEQRFGKKPEVVACISPVIGCHSGPGTVSVFFVSNNPRG